MFKSRDEWLVIAVSGVTCGGKTTLANQLYERISPVYIFNQDKYFYPDDSPKHIKCEGLEHNDYDILSALDMEHMYEDVVSTMNGENKAHQWRTDLKDGDYRINTKKIIIIEGFTVLNYKPLAELSDMSGRASISIIYQPHIASVGGNDSDKKHCWRWVANKNIGGSAKIFECRFYLVLSLGECALRRSMRLYDPPDVAGYFDLVVWPHHLTYRAEIEKDPRVIFLEGSDYTALDKVMNLIRNIK